MGGMGGMGGMGCMGGMGGMGGGFIQTLPTEKAVMINGCSFSILQHLCSVENWNTLNNWSLLTNFLSHPRYNMLENYIHDLLSNAGGSAVNG